MESTQIVESKKRAIGQITAQELSYKLKSKMDFIVYLDKHCKYLESRTLVVCELEYASYSVHDIQSQLWVS